jgi:hypothetical protein
MGYRTVFSWALQDNEALPAVAVDILLAMLRARLGMVSFLQLHNMNNKTFCIVGQGSRFSAEILAVYRHDDHWKVIAFSHADWIRTYKHRSQEIQLDYDTLPAYCE